jgi:ribonuclease Z
MASVGNSVPYNGFQLSFLGTSSGVPTHSRGVSLIGVRHGGEHWIVDCGEGSQSRLRTSATMSVSRINRIFITHLHGDHTWGLLGVIASNLIGTDYPTPLTIYGPPGIADFCIRALKSTYTSYPQNLLRFQEIGSDKSNLQNDGFNNYTLVETDKLLIRASAIRHTIPCIGYVFEEKTKRGTLNVDAVKELGFMPGPIYKHIQDQWNKKEISIPIATSSVDHVNGGRGGVLDEKGECLIVEREKIISTPLRGRKIVILGDTCDPSGIAEIAKDSCVLVHECTLPSAYGDMAFQRGHSTGTMAAKFAQSISSRTLVLTHFSPRFNNNMINAELRKAQEYFSGDIYAASDFDVLDIPPRLATIYNFNSNNNDTRPTLYKYPFNNFDLPPSLSTIDHSHTTNDPSATLHEYSLDNSESQDLESQFNDEEVLLADFEKDRTHNTTHQHTSTFPRV